MFSSLVDIFKWKLDCKKNAKSSSGERANKFVHPLKYFEFHKKVFNTWVKNCLAQLHRVTPSQYSELVFFIALS